jgi:hypothetical protein
MIKKTATKKRNQQKATKLRMQSKNLHYSNSLMMLMPSVPQEMPTTTSSK